MLEKYTSIEHTWATNTEWAVQVRCSRYYKLASATLFIIVFLQLASGQDSPVVSVIDSHPKVPSSRPISGQIFSLLKIKI